MALIRWIADVLFGIENPFGRTPITTPRTAGQRPLFHGHQNGSEPSTHTDLDDRGPVYPFGHGLTDTTFEYRVLTVDRAEVAADGSVDVSVEEANTGVRFGEEASSSTRRSRADGISRPVRELVGFDRVSLDVGGVARVTFTLRADILAYGDVDMNMVMTPGDVEFRAGPSSTALPLSTVLTFTGEPATLGARTAHLTPSTVVSF